MRRNLALAAALATAGCVSGAHLAGLQTATPAFDPVAFFSGHTEGRGILKVAFKHRQPTLVSGRGTVEPDGSILLIQEVRRGSQPSTTRMWHLHATSADHYAGTLTDSTEPVTGDVAGNRLHLRFSMKGGLQAQQWLYLQVGGQVAKNVIVVSKFGLPVARLDETISRLDR